MRISLAIMCVLSGPKGIRMYNEAIDAAIKIVGSQLKLAEACNVKQPSVWAWLHGKKKHHRLTLSA